MTGMATAIVGMAGAFWKILMWWKKESESRLKDSQALSKIVGGDDETKVK
tara:strand:- start:268 stop:417 length:150 start_codon:yes stop_codon:yes gene_type:complete